MDIRVLVFPPIFTERRTKMSVKLLFRALLRAFGFLEAGARLSLEDAGLKREDIQKLRW